MLQVSRQSLSSSHRILGKELFITKQIFDLKRHQSSFVQPISPDTRQVPLSATNLPKLQTSSPLQRLSTWHLMRNMILSAFLTNPIIYKPGFAFVQMIANSKSPLLNPDRNPFLRAVLKPVLYNHFCAGTNAREISETISETKRIGFSGVALIYNKEIQPHAEHESSGFQQARVSEIEQWRAGTLLSLKMIPSGNWLGMKITGAGPEVEKALLKGQDPPESFVSAMKEICEAAKQKGCTLWVDGEQQTVQHTIDKWTIDLMRQYNRDEALVYTTVQAYLKEGKHKLVRQLSLAQKEGWVLGVKLVRGAYMATDQRGLIHDCKADTDACYDGIVRDLLSGTLEAFSKENFPRLRLVLAGHNSETVRKALVLGRELAAKGELKVSPAFAQLQGMADDVGGEIIQFGDEVMANEQGRATRNDSRQVFIPRVYKALHWGTIQESMQYLVRRAVENSAAVGRMREGAMESRRELMSRLKPRLWKN